LLDFVPAFTNELRDDPAFVQGSELVCTSGRVLDILTGRDKGQLLADEVKKHERPTSEAQTLYNGRFQNTWTRIRLPNGLWLSHKARPEEESTGFRLYILGDDDSVQWCFDLANTGYHIAGNYYSYRYAAPFVYLMVSEERQHLDVPGKPGQVWATPNPTVYHLLTLDLDRRSIVQDFRVADGKLEECRIEDVDEAGLLVSVDQRQLRYYHRRLS
jgi:hypothetical protein